MRVRTVLRTCLSVVVLIACSSALVWGNESEGLPRKPSRGTLSVEDLTRLGTRILRDIFNRSGEVLQNYVEVEGGHRSGLQEGTEGGHLTLRLYPRGKAESDEHYTAEAWFRFSSPHEKETFSYSFKLLPPHPSTIRPEDYI
jgi:hypothetical protein